MALGYKKKMAPGIMIVIFFVVLDRFLKFLAVNNYFTDSIKMGGGFLKLNFVPNYNIAFSLPARGAFLDLIIIFIIIGLLYNLIFLLKKLNYEKSFFLVLVLAGAISNFTDRIKFGFVIDYFDLKYFTVFNFADIMIVGGIIGLIYYFIYKKHER